MMIYICSWNLILGSTGATNMNLHSSRSHAIFTVTIECSEKGPDGKLSTTSLFVQVNTKNHHSLTLVFT
jgi:hypothetical protein